MTTDEGIGTGVVVFFAVGLGVTLGIGSSVGVGAGVAVGCGVHHCSIAGMVK